MSTNEVTTSDLRSTLYDSMNKVIDGKMSHREANSVAVLADKILKSAEVEMNYNNTVDRLKKDGVKPTLPGSMTLISPPSIKTEPLTDEDKKNIVQLYKEQVDIAELSRKFGVPVLAINAVVQDGLG